MRSGKPKDFESSSKLGRERSRHHTKPSDGKSLPISSRIDASPKRHSSASVDSSSGKGLRKYLNKFIDFKAFSVSLRGWLQDKLSLQELCNPPFQLNEIQEFDLALEGIQFQQLIRMPNLSSSSSSLSVASIDIDTCLALEDFLHTSAQNLWGRFWKSDGVPPFFITGSHEIFSTNASRGTTPSKEAVKESECAALLVRSDAGAEVLWEHILQFVLLKPNLGDASHENVSVLSPMVTGQAVFYALNMLLSRKMADNQSAVIKDPNVAYVILVDSQYGSVVRVQGDISELDINSTDVYEAASAWVQEKAQVAISTTERVWNRLGNANWGDFGALQLLLATFHCIEQCLGPPKQSITELATKYRVQLQSRKREHKIVEAQHQNGADVVSYLPRRNHGEIVEIEEEIEPDDVKELDIIKLDRGSVIRLEDSQWQKGFKILEDYGGSRQSAYSGIALDEADKFLNVYVGAHPSQQEVRLDYMGTWYQVQRQTRVLNLMKERGVSSKYLPQLIASGRILHPGTCMKQSPGGQCGHPWCGTPILVTAPVGEPLDIVIQKKGVFTPDEALRCCHDSLSCLQSVNSVGIQHGDITPQHVIQVVGADREKYHVLIEWGHAVIEDRDSPGISLQFSSTSALQEGKLCPASDAESLVYLLYFLCGGTTPQFDSIESALQWRERLWSRRSIQQQLGETSAVLKAFADYVDSLCGTPYPVDYEIWLRRLNRALNSEDSGRSIEPQQTITGTDDLAESSGTSGGSPN